MKSALESRQEVETLQKQWVSQLFMHFGSAVEAAVTKGLTQTRVYQSMKYPEQAKNIEQRFKELGYKARYFPQAGWPSESEAHFHITW